MLFLKIPIIAYIINFFEMLKRALYMQIKDERQPAGKRLLNVSIVFTMK